MRIESIVIRMLEMELVEGFRTSLWETRKRIVLIIELHADDMIGYGECTAGENPYYSYETYETALIILRKYLVRMILGKEFEDPYEFRKSLEGIRGHKMAKTSLEYAFWDLYGKQQGKPLYEIYGGTKRRVSVGVSIGIKEDVSELIKVIEEYLERGYRRIKIKIMPGYDIDVVRTIRDVYPGIPLMVDANGAYTMAHREVFKTLDKYNLLMIEQPLHYEDLLDHAELQCILETPICLDESITSLGAAKIAAKLGSCRIINIKPPRVGGVIESMKIHDYAGKVGIRLWIGGMLETGVGKVHLLHIASLPNINYPSDIAESCRYWMEDIIDPPNKLNKDGAIDVPTKPGIGVEIREDLLEKYQRKQWVYSVL